MYACMRNRRCLESRADNVARNETKFGKWWIKRASVFDIALHCALGKLKMRNAELKEQQRVVLEYIYNGHDGVRLASYRIRLIAVLSTYIVLRLTASLS